MRYENTITGEFIKRPNRFIAYCLINGKEEKVHVPNTGRCKELLVPGAKVILNRCSEEKLKTRKTEYDLVSVYKGNRLVNLDSQSPNLLAVEGLKNGKIMGERKFSFIQREKTFGNSRFDIYYEREEKGNRIKGFIEVKGVTLEEGNQAFFPDAPTERGLKHLKELVEAKEAGYETSVLFVVQMENIKMFYPNLKTQREFGKQLLDCENNGVEILCYGCNVQPSEVKINESIDVCNLREYLEINKGEKQ